MNYMINSDSVESHERNFSFKRHFFFEAPIVEIVSKCSKNATTWTICWFLERVSSEIWQLTFFGGIYVWAENVHTILYNHFDLEVWN